MKLSPTQIKVLALIKQGRGERCLKGYRFSSAAVLERHHLIEGDRMQPYWTWRLTDMGRFVLRAARFGEHLA